MSREPSGTAETAGPHAADRRAFLRGLAAVGAGALGAAAAAEAAPPRQLGVSNATLGRASRANLTLKTGLARLQVAQPKPVPADLRPLSLRKLAKAPVPSARARLLNAMSGSPGGAELLNDAGLELSSAGKLGFSKPLQVMSSNALATAYAAGIVLTPTGCLYADGVVAPAKPPIFYQSWCGSLSVEEVTACRCYVHGSQASVEDAVLWFCFITTPGSPSNKLTYLLELSINSVYGDYLDRLKFSLELSYLTMSPTSDGTLVATVQMCGTEDIGAAYLFGIHRNGYALGSFGFNWLNVMAL